MATDMTVANTIAQQMGGTGRLAAMIGANGFTGSADSLVFRFRAKAAHGINTVAVTLDPSDTYTVRFVCVRKVAGVPTARTVAEYENVYAEDLIPLFERTTGLYLTFGRRAA